jgi:hypothetical protein
MLGGRSASQLIGLRSVAGQGMSGTDETEDQALERLRGLADETVEQARRVRKEAGQAAGAVTQAHQQAASARVRAALAKRRELAAHARAIKLHEQAANLQERLGHPDRAATARAHAEHARELQRQALAEQREQQR